MSNVFYDLNFPSRRVRLFMASVFSDRFFISHWQIGFRGVYFNIHFENHFYMCLFLQPLSIYDINIEFLQIISVDWMSSIAGVINEIRKRGLKRHLQRREILWTIYMHNLNIYFPLFQEMLPLLHQKSRKFKFTTFSSHQNLNSIIEFQMKWT